MAKGPSKALPSSSKAGRLERISDRGGLQRCHRRSFRGIRYGVRRSSGCPWLEKSQQTTAAVRVTAWDIISGVDSSDDGMTRAAAQGTALAYLLRDASTLRFGSVTIADVARLLQGVACSLRYWAWETGPRTRSSAPAHWDVENEYHVQDMLGVVLALPPSPILSQREFRFVPKMPPILGHAPSASESSLCASRCAACRRTK